MNILVLTKAKNHPLQTVLNTLGNVILSENPVKCDLCITSKHPTPDQINQLGSTPIIFFVETEPLAQDIDAFLYTHANHYSSYKCILLPDVYATSKSYLETRYPNIPVKLINPVLAEYPNKLFEGVRKQTPKINLFIRASNANFSDNSWRQLCIAEQAFHTNPELINEVYLFNVPSNKCAVDMYENLEIFKQKKLRTFIEFEPHQIVQHFSLQPQRSIYLMNSVVDGFDPLAIYCLQDQIGVVHTSEYLKQNNLGKHYKSYEIDNAVNLIKAYATETLETNMNEFCKKFSDKHVLVNTVKEFGTVPTKPIKSITSSTYSPKDLSVPLVIGYDNNLDRNENTKYFTNTLKKSGWEYAIISISDVWNGFKDKLSGIKSFLDTLPDDKIVVISETHETLCSRTSKQFIQGFKSKGKDIIVSMELLCYGKFESDVPRDQCVPLTKYWQANKREQIPFRKFVSNGLLCGKVSAIKKFYTWAENSGETSEQKALANYMNAFPNEMYADDTAEILHTSVFGFHGGILSYKNQIQDSPTFSELFGRGAFFLHIPGLDDDGQKTIYKYAKVMLDLGTSESSIQRKGVPELDYHGNFVDGSKLIIN
jgi:hypothetical protein